MLNDTYDQCYLNYQLSDLSLDCVVNINDCKIDIEYDGIYWHQDYQKDRRRDEFVKSCGYKILRIKSDRHIPALEEIKEKINVLVNTDKQYQEILVQKYNTQ
jgi:very-short-patch-repair endonuclease